MFLSTQCGLSATVGFLSHICVFIRGEYHLWAASLLRLYLFLAAFLFLSQIITRPNDTNAAGAVLLIVTSYAVALFSSMAVYRVFFHRLRGFPGPYLAKLTKFWHVYHVLDAQQYLFLDQLRKRYGAFVRTGVLRLPSHLFVLAKTLRKFSGPNELTIFDAKAVMAIHGSDTRCTEAEWYDNLRPLTAINTTRSKALHEKRRKIWDMGFSQKALDVYEPRVLHYATQLSTAFNAFGSKPVNATAWFSYFGFDVMSELTFGKPMNMLRDGKSHHIRDILTAGIIVLGPLTPVPWLFHLAGSIPRMTKDWLEYRGWVLGQLKERMQSDGEGHDVMSWLIQAGEGDNKWESSWLEGDAVSMVIAGTEPEAASLTFLFYHLAKNPLIQQKLRAELKLAFFPMDARTLQALPFLNGCINEGLRLHPPLPSGFLRHTPPEGLSIDGVFVPGNTTVLTPAYGLGRLDSCFEAPEDFVPERWNERPEMVRDKTAWIPFNIGAYYFDSSTSRPCRHHSYADLRQDATYVLDETWVSWS